MSWSLMLLTPSSSRSSRLMLRGRGPHSWKKSIAWATAFDQLEDRAYGIFNASNNHQKVETLVLGFKIARKVAYSTACDHCSCIFQMPAKLPVLMPLQIINDPNSISPSGKQWCWHLRREYLPEKFCRQYSTRTCEHSSLWGYGQTDFPSKVEHGRI